MENDHLEDAIRFLRGALRQEAEFGRMSRHSIERALEEVEAERAKRDAENVG